MNPDLLGDRQEAFEISETASDEPFDQALDKSFLPHIVNLAEERGIQLIFIRSRKRRDLVPGAEPQSVQRYIAELRAWLDVRDIPLIDLTHEERLTADLYASGDHLNRHKGRDTFTKILAERLEPVFCRANSMETADAGKEATAESAGPVFPLNPGFETWCGFYPNRPKHWRSYYMNDIAHDTDEIREGRSALVLTSPAGQRTEVFQDIPLPPGAAGHRLVFEAEARTDTPDAARLSIMLFDGSWHITDGQAHPGDGSWHTIRVEQQVAHEPGPARLYLKTVFNSNHPGARAHFDAQRLRVE